MQFFDVVIIGGGPAGLSAAIAAKEKGVETVLVIERESELGGALNQYIHAGFNRKAEKQQLTGPEYAQKLIDRLEELNIKSLLKTEVIDISEERLITAVNESGINEIKAKSIILALGAREKPKGTINIQGRSCAGIFTAGATQRFINNEGFMPGKHAVVIGSGDTGLIAAKSMVLEGANINAIVESGTYPKGSRKNIQECVKEFRIPLRLEHKVIDIKGKDRVEGVTVVKLDANSLPIQGSEEFIPCDTLILSMGLRPENELLKRSNIEVSDSTNGVIIDENFITSHKGIFACGNVIHLHNRVDEVAEEGNIAGENATDFCKGKSFNSEKIGVSKGYGIKYVVPRYITLQDFNENLSLSLRTNSFYRNSFITFYLGKDKIMEIYKEELIPGETEKLLLEKTLFKACNKNNLLVVKIENNEKTGI